MCSDDPCSCGGCGTEEQHGARSKAWRRIRVAAEEDEVIAVTVSGDDPVVSEVQSTLGRVRQASLQPGLLARMAGVVADPPIASPHRILVVGSLDERMNNVRLVTGAGGVAERVRDAGLEVQWTVVGGGGDTARSGGGARVEVKEYVSEAEMRRLYSCSSLVVIPCRSSAVPVAALEAMSCGVACLVTARCDLRGVFGGYKSRTALEEDESRGVKLSDCLVRVSGDDGEDAAVWARRIICLLRRGEEVRAMAWRVREEWSGKWEEQLSALVADVFGDNDDDVAGRGPGSGAGSGE